LSIPLSLTNTLFIYFFLVSAGEEERERFISELESFIAQLLKMVEVELKFNYETLSKISGQIHGKMEMLFVCIVKFNLLNVLR
jgi:hypothetical protein